MKIISLGHRCHINQMLIKYNLRSLAFPFDNIISKLEGVIHCIENDFECYFPQKIEKELFFVGKNHHEADKDGNRFVIRNKFFAFTHHDLTDISIIDNFRNRIKRFMDMLENTTEEILFIRTVMDNDEIKLIDKLNHVLKKKFPNLNFKIAFIYDNISLDESIWYYKNKYIISNSYHKINDQNDKTSSMAYQYFFNYIVNKKTLDEIFKHTLEIPDNFIFKNDSYKGWALKKGIYPYNDKL